MTPRTSPQPSPVEEIPRGPGEARTWGLFLCGPVAWSAHFVAVYLTAEAVCSRAPSAEATFRVFVVTATVVAAGIATAGSVLSLRHRRVSTRDDASATGWIGTLLGAGSAFAIVAVGLPVVVLDACS